MNILFLTLSEITNLHERGLYLDLIHKLAAEGNTVTVINPSERRRESNTELIQTGHINLLKVRTPNLQKANNIEKAVGTVLLECLLIRAIDKYLKNEKYDLFIYTTPPVTITRLIRRVKKMTGATTYLLLKDIFPQNAVDLQMMRGKSVIYNYFRRKEKLLYALSDYIGCMSPANVQYLLDHNPEIERTKVEIFPNSISPLGCPVSVEEREIIHKKYNLPFGRTLFIYGGNIGKPQATEFLIEVLQSNISNESVYFVIAGSGTEYYKVKRWFNNNRPANACLKPFMAKEEFDRLVGSCDIGMIFLDKRFTVPNYPSRLLTYMENRLPVIMATDRHTDIGKIAEENGYGFWCESGDLMMFNSFISQLSENKELRKTMGDRAFDYLLKNYTVDVAAAKILEKFSTP